MGTSSDYFQKFKTSPYNMVKETFHPLDKIYFLPNCESEVEMKTILHLITQLEHLLGEWIFNRLTHQ